MSRINIYTIEGNKDTIQDFFQNENYINLETDEFMTSEELKDFCNQEFNDYIWSKDYIDDEDFFEQFDLLDYGIYSCSSLEEQFGCVSFKMQEINEIKSLLIIAYIE